MLMWIAVILVILWLLGFIGHVGGGFIHIVLVIAALVFLYDVLISRRRHT
jgi:4-hydroxybenzoate polyprenyltransferase